MVWYVVNFCIFYRVEVSSFGQINLLRADVHIWFHLQMLACLANKICSDTDNTESNLSLKGLDPNALCRKKHCIATFLPQYLVLQNVH